MLPSHSRTGEPASRSNLAQCQVYLFNSHLLAADDVEFRLSHDILYTLPQVGTSREAPSLELLASIRT
ncbi:hypothetical protein IFM51744_04311 [Aspergillus udagawae]|uniref:Uncharacterized protein n=1 Tax=Aspergillus udagawae TaxID=91492 RepID=A0ABQ1AGA4_9EURO|nr:hypothetical protein IFM51744_04311 [Aspergillus udagawae]GFF81371.1 hypothetical protein IFM53868_03113 [Aspergillus udagawae]